MKRIRVTLSIGYPSASHEDILEIPDEEWDDCETEEQRDELMSEYWQDWSNELIDGGSWLIDDGEVIMNAKEKLLNLYKQTNKMLAYLGAEGEIDTRNFLVDKVEDALYKIDGGEYKMEPITKLIDSLRVEVD